MENALTITQPKNILWITALLEGKIKAPVSSWRSNPAQRFLRSNPWSVWKGVSGSFSWDSWFILSVKHNACVNLSFFSAHDLIHKQHLSIGKMSIFRFKDGFPSLIGAVVFETTVRTRECCWPGSKRNLANKDKSNWCAKYRELRLAQGIQTFSFWYDHPPACLVKASAYQMISCCQVGVERYVGLYGVLGWGYFTSLSWSSSMWCHYIFFGL